MFGQKPLLVGFSSTISHFIVPLLFCSNASCILLKKLFVSALVLAKLYI